MRAKLVALACLLAVLLTLGGPASAHDDVLRKHGSCSGGPSEWRLVVRRGTDPGVLRVRFVIWGGKAGQTWQLFLSDNGTRFFVGSKVSGSGGVVGVARRTRNRVGWDVIKAGGLNLVTGESCTGSLSY